MKLTESEFNDLRFFLGKATIDTLPSTDRNQLIQLIRKEMPEADTSTPNAQLYYGYLIVGKIEHDKIDKIRSISTNSSI